RSGNARRDLPDAVTPSGVKRSSLTPSGGVADSTAAPLPPGEKALIPMPVFPPLETLCIHSLKALSRIRI
ncbi:MAG: hypothetical protein V4710_05080, partial [Verrucomicrobiota bacterium]